MADLKAFKRRQEERKNESSKGTVEAADANERATSADAGADADKDSSESIPTESSATESSSTSNGEAASGSNQSGKPKRFGVGGGGQHANASKDAPRSKLAGFGRVNRPSSASTGTPSTSQSETTKSIGAKLDNLESAKQPAKLESPRFDDEVPAAKPLRDVAAIEEMQADLESKVDSMTDKEEAAARKDIKLMQQFTESLDSVYDLLHDPELLRNVISSIMIELKANPQYTRLLAKEDVRTWIKTMRDAMGLAVIKKSEKRTPAKKKSAASKKREDLLADLGGLGISLDGLGD